MSQQGKIFRKSFDKDEIRMSQIQPETSASKKGCACCVNLKNIWCYQA